MKDDVVLFFFFFKQKTAYEIKECDWSSDVCSSDLGLRLVGTLPTLVVQLLGHRHVRLRSERDVALGYEIGRASCRERV